jgi:hypothetical protein
METQGKIAEPHLGNVPAQPSALKALATRFFNSRHGKSIMKRSSPTSSSMSSRAQTLYSRNLKTGYLLEI